MTSQPDELSREIAAEQAYVDTVYERLEAATKAAEQLQREGYARGHIGHEGGLVERDAMVHHAARRIAALNAAHDGLVFGRLDLVEGEAHYIGRIGVRDADHEILLVDWRAPFAAAFYQATASDPRGVVRRRVLRCAADKVIGIEDELLDAEAAPDDMVVIGEGALLASLSRARDATMHTVVATIQAEQDEAIRAPSKGATIITGGPGTGKTVVALHRAAYLLYTDRQRFERGGVLVVGPSGVFMDYIARVLPSLGETSVTLRSLGEVVDGVRAHRHDPPLAAAVKGSVRMTKVLRAAVSGRQPAEPTEFRYFYRDDVLLLDAPALEGLRRELLSGGMRRNRAVTRAPAAVIEALWSQVRGERALDKGRDFFVHQLTGDDAFIDFMESWWPPLDAVEVWRTLPDRLPALAGRAFTPEEIDALVASWTGQDEPSVEDVPLIDELRYLLGEVERDADADEYEGVKQIMSFEREDRERRPQATSSIEDDGYAHVLVDEAQDLSPMQWRMVGRRGRAASWTIVGDEAQSSWPYPSEQAEARGEALRGKDEHVFRLSTNYRNSAEIYELAAHVARVAVGDPDLARAVRRTGVEPVVETRADADRALVEAVRSVAEACEGTVAVVTPAAEIGWVETGLAGLLAEHGSRLRVLDGLQTKGLEFDGVVVYEPDAIAEESPTGWRTLYVVLSRATQRLHTVGTTRRWLEKAGL